jgi:predicted phosphodiesterase
MLRRVGVVGDIHCEDELLELVLRHFAGEGTDATLAVGDIVDGVGDVNRACSLLAEHGVFTVAGNHDRWILERSMRELPNATAAGTLRGEARTWLERLPTTRSFQTPLGGLLLCHGLGEDDMAGLRPDDHGYSPDSNLALWALVESRLHRFVVNGHTHEAMVRKIGQLTIINAGTLDRNCRQVCSVIGFESGSVQFYEVVHGGMTSAERFGLD